MVELLYQRLRAYRLTGLQPGGQIDQVFLVIVDMRHSLFLGFFQISQAGIPWNSK